MNTQIRSFLKTYLPAGVRRSAFVQALQLFVLQGPEMRQLWKETLTLKPGRLLWLAHLVEHQYGHFLSSTLQQSVNNEGQPLPWYTYPAIEYLSNLDFSDKDVFEYGSGNSSLWWADHAKSVVSVEDDIEWHTAMNARRLPNQEFRFIQDRNDYVHSIAADGKKYDVVIVDGSHRRACVEAALPFLASGGMLIMDNTNWFPKSAHRLREADLIQVDFAGMSPINHYTLVTSAFFTRTALFRPRTGRQPEPSIGCIDYIDSETL